MDIMNELDTVVLTKDIKKHGLKKDDIGTIVHIYKGDSALEVEFITAGKTVDVITLTTSDVRSMATNEILHVRGFASI